MLDVISSLVMREMQSRYGERGLGYFWGILEPAMYVGVAISWFIVTNKFVMVGWSMPLFLITGIAPYILFYRVDQFVRSSIVFNLGLLYHPSVSPLHLMLARFCLEAPTGIFFMFIIIFGYYLWSHDPMVIPVHPAAVVEAISLDLLFAFGVGGAIAPIMIRYPGLGWSLGFLVRVIYMTAGVHYVPDYAPKQWQPIIFWNPMTHIITLFRTGFGLNYPAHHLNAVYTLAWGGGLLFLALVMERYYGRQWIEA